MNYFKHETAIIDQGAIIGDNTKVWHWTHISSKARIGIDCSFGQNVYIANEVLIGNNVKVQNNVSIYDNIVLEDHVFCGPSMVFTNVVNPRSEVVRKSEYKSTLVKRGSTIGANATILCGVTLHEYCFIAAGAVVNKDVKAFALMAGVPARQIGWMSRYGERVKLPLEGNGTYQCPHSDDSYELNNNTMLIKS